MFPRYAIETISLPSFAERTRAQSKSKSSIISSTQPCSCLVFAALGFTSAVTEITPAILPALGCAPDIPPRPAVTNSFPSLDSLGFVILRIAFKTVMVVP